MTVTTPGYYESVMNALLALLQAQLGDTFRYYSRRFMVWEDVVSYTQNEASPVNQPALFLYDGVGFGGGMIAFEQRARGLPARRTMHRNIVIYARVEGGGTLAGKDLTTAGSIQMHALQEAVENALSPEVGDRPGGTLTLGGLVSHVWIEGEVMLIPGDIDPGGQGMLVVPVRILLP